MSQINQSKSKWQSLFFRIAAIALALLLALWLVKLGTKIFVISSAIQTQTFETQTAKNTDQYAIFSKIIEEGIIQDSTELILIEDGTSYGLLIEGLGNERPSHAEISAELWEDFWQKNQSTTTLSQSFTLSKPYLLINSSNREKINRTLLFANNVEHTPFLLFSKIGFNQLGNEALVHISMFSWGDNFFNVATFGYGKYIYLKEINEVWRILNEWDSFII